MVLSPDTDRPPQIKNFVFFIRRQKEFDALQITNRWGYRGAGGHHNNPIFLRVFLKLSTKGSTKPSLVNLSKWELGPITELSIEVNLRAGGPYFKPKPEKKAPKVTGLHGSPLDPCSLLSSHAPNGKDLELTVEIPD